LARVRLSDFIAIPASERGVPKLRIIQCLGAIVAVAVGGTASPDAGAPDVVEQPQDLGGDYVRFSLQAFVNTPIDFKGPSELKLLGLSTIDPKVFAAPFGS
jgi:hypothetical protein